MRVHIVLLICILAVSVATNSARELRRSQPRRPSILVLGTYHMENPDRDVFNAQSDDVRGAKRQKELAELVAMLARYRPTKIVVEAPYGSAKINEQYRGYLAGTFELPPNELHQIGFRLAKALGHTQVYPVDWQGKFDLDPVMAAASRNNQTAVVEQAMAFGKSFVDELNAMIKSKSIPEILRWVNDDRRVDEGEQLYLRIARVGKGDDYAGADLVADWHERNLKIFANILRVTDSPDDRILVIYGAGHAKLLTELAEDSGEYVVERPSAYLR
jgi:hypothetical protein